LKYIVTVNGKKFEVEVEREGGAKSLSRSPIAPRAPMSAPAAASAPVSAPVPAAPAPAQTASAPSPAAPGGKTVSSPLPGMVLDIKVSQGEAVKYGQVLLTLEAMKMETEIVAPADGVVESILAKKGDAVETGAQLVILK
jgi:pyruvate dehydrogenase E2 component (dihydrolipoamide acetyltransferase)